MSEEQEDIAGQENAHITSISSLGDRMSKIETTLDALKGMLGGKGNAPAEDDATPDAGDFGSRVNAEVERALKAKAEAEAREKAEADKRSADEQLRADVARLKETPPAAPVKRATRALGWGG